MIFEVLMHLEEYKWFRKSNNDQTTHQDSPIPEEETDERNLILMFARGILLFILDNPFQLSVLEDTRYADVQGTL